MFENITPGHPTETSISNLLSLIGKPTRIQILMVIHEQEACVCHLETVLGLRQATISQHLMVMRKAGLVITHRDGRHIFYWLARPELVDLLEQAASIIGSDLNALRSLSSRPISGCPCPQCNPEMDIKLTCQTNAHKKRR
ncbi:MAG: ArsR/SmtB family transcription factor [Bellilinea sp.]